MTDELKIKPGSLYHVLYGLLDDRDVCDGNQFKVMRDGALIKVSEVQAEINILGKSLRNDQIMLCPWALVAEKTSIWESCIQHIFRLPPESIPSYCVIINQ